MQTTLINALASNTQTAFNGGVQQQNEMDGDFAGLLAMLNPAYGSAQPFTDTASLGMLNQQTLSLEDMQALLGAGGLNSGTLLQPDNALLSAEFGQLVQRLFLQLNQLTPDDLTAKKAHQLLSLVRKLQQDLLSVMEQNGQLSLAQQWLSIAGGHPADDPTGTLITTDEWQTMSQQSDDPLATMRWLLRGEPQDILQQLTGIPKESFTQLAETYAQQLPAADQDASWQGLITGAEYSKGTDAFDKAAAQAAKDVDTAKQILLEKPAKDHTILDVDRLQQQVDSGVHLQNTSFLAAANHTLEAEPQPEAAPAFHSQVFDGVLTSLKQGQEQYVMKLVPKELGELTIRIVKDADGAMTLNLIAKTGEAQKLLAAEAAQLQHQLKPLNVQLQPVTTQHEQSLLDQQQTFARERQHQTWQSQSRQSHTAHTATPPGADEAPVQTPHQTPQSLLNAYV